MRHESSDEGQKASGLRGAPVSRSPEGRAGIIVLVLSVFNAMSMLHELVRSPESLKALPYALFFYAFVTIYYSIAFSWLVRKDTFNSLSFLVPYHALLGTLTFLHAYLYDFVKAAMRGGAPYPGWIHLTWVKDIAFSNTLWLAMHAAFLLLAIVISHVRRR
jgi:hypothetical protein